MISFGCGIISSYKGHTIFAFILSLFLFQNPLAIALAIVGANLPDFDHKFKKDQVLSMYILGLVLFLGLFLFNQPYYLGLVIMLIATIFFFSNHRGFTHSILGIAILTALVSIIILLGFYLSISALNILGFSDSKLLALAIVIIFMGILSLNKKILPLFVVLFLIAIVAFPNFTIGVYKIIFSVFLGLLSHIVLDSFTPAGLTPFAPFSHKKYYKSFGLAILVLILIFWILCSNNLNFIFKF